MGLVGAENELVRWPYEYQFFIRDCGALYISLPVFRPFSLIFHLQDIEKRKHVPRFPLVSIFFRQPFFQQRKSPILTVVADGHVYEITGAYEDVGRGGTGIHRVQQFSVE